MDDFELRVANSADVEHLTLLLNSLIYNVSLSLDRTQLNRCAWCLEIVEAPVHREDAPPEPLFNYPNSPHQFASLRPVPFLVEGPEQDELIRYIFQAGGREEFEQILGEVRALNMPIVLEPHSIADGKAALVWLMRHPLQRRGGFPIQRTTRAQFG